MKPYKRAKSKKGKSSEKEYELMDWWYAQTQEPQNKGGDEPGPGSVYTNNHSEKR